MQTMYSCKNGTDEPVADVGGGGGSRGFQGKWENVTPFLYPVVESAACFNEKAPVLA